MKKLGLLALCASLMLPLAALAGKMPLVDPDPIMVPANTAADTVAFAVLKGLTERHWQSLPSTTPGVVHAHIAAHGGDQASVDIIYDTTKVQIHYVGSSEMGEEMVDGQRMIGSRYINWSHNLAESISQALGIKPLQ